MRELGLEVTPSKEIFKVSEVISNNPRQGLDDQRERAHFISLAYMCSIPDGKEINNNKLQMNNGYLQWFPSMPDNLLVAQEFYREPINTYSRRTI